MRFDYQGADVMFCCQKGNALCQKKTSRSKANDCQNLLLALALASKPVPILMRPMTALRRNVDDDVTKQKVAAAATPTVCGRSIEDPHRTRRKTRVRRMDRLSVICWLVFCDNSNVRGFTVTRTGGNALCHNYFASKNPPGRSSSASPSLLHATRDRKEIRPKDLASATDWDVSDSLGSLLEKMHQNDEAMLLSSRGKGKSTNGIVEELAPIPKTKSQNKVHVESSSAGTWSGTTSSSSRENEDAVDLELPSSTMDKQTAKQLDAAVSPVRRGLFQRLVQEDMQVIPLSNLYTTTTGPASLTQSVPGVNATATTLPWSQPEHYLDRIDRDRRHLAVSIAASITDESQWKAFCHERGGLYPILQTIREGARAITRHHERRNQRRYRYYYESKNAVLLRTDLLDSQREESFRAACSACRAIRDLCTISPDQAAVITDGILRANAAWGGNLMEDFRLILQYAKEYTAAADSAIAKRHPRFLLRFRSRRDTRLRCKLYVTQLLLELTIASDDAVAAIRSHPGLVAAIVDCSSYAVKEQTKRWIRYPAELVKWVWRRSLRRSSKTGEAVVVHPPFMEAARLSNDLLGQVQRCSNQILAAIGYNKWVPKIPGQKGLRVLALDGGGSRGMVTVKILESLMEEVGEGREVSDSFDVIVGTSTGGIVAFLVGLEQETSKQAVERYEQLIAKIFVKSALSTPLMLFTTASYDESHFMKVLEKILQENSMLDSRADPSVPYVCAVSSKMSSTPTHVALFRNYNYADGEQKDPFVVDPDKARENLELPISTEHAFIRKGSYKSPGLNDEKKAEFRGSRHPGSFRVLQRYALRASTAAPTIFKPVMMGGEMYCDGGIVASNPTAVAIHEARSLFPDIPIELVVSVGTGVFLEQKSPARVGWDGIIGQIVNSATDSEQVHHIMEDLVGGSAFVGQKEGSMMGDTRYFRFNPTLGAVDKFPIDVTAPAKLVELQEIATQYMAQPEQRKKIKRVSEILHGKT